MTSSPGTPDSSSWSGGPPGSAPPGPPAVTTPSPSTANAAAELHRAEVAHPLAGAEARRAQPGGEEQPEHAAAVAGVGGEQLEHLRVAPPRRSGEGEAHHVGRGPVPP